MNEEVIKFRNSVFDLSSRAFGEDFIQKILYKLLNDKPYDGRRFDAIREREGKPTLNGEYKAVRAVFTNKKSKNLFERVMDVTPMSQRIASFEDIKSGKLVSNFQNIKLKDVDTFEFDYLTYVLADADGLKIFEITGEEMKNKIASGEYSRWSDKHGSKETGKNGQFVICKENLEWHRQFLIKFLTWEEVLEISKTIE